MMRSSLQVLRLVPRFTASFSTQSARLSKGLKLTFASPKEVYYSQVDVKQVDCPTLTGSMGILAEHVPLLGCLKPGVVNIHEESGTIKKFFVSSGTVTVNDDSSIQVLAEEVATLDTLDSSAIREGLSAAQSTYNSAADGVAKAEAQVALEAYEALSKALEH